MRNHSRLNAGALFVFFQVLTGCSGFNGESDAATFEEDADLDIAAREQAIINGLSVPAGALEAVGRVPGCTATLVDHQIVLTAAHCVCPSDHSPVGCATRTSFTLYDVRPVDDPATPQDESTTRRDVTIPGAVTVHPDYGRAGWLRKDYAVVVLDRPAYKHAVDVVPIPMAKPNRKPLLTDRLTAVGFAARQSDCSDSSGTKRSRMVTPSEIVDEAIRFSPRLICPGDSGGPLLDKTGVYAVGIASFNAGSASTYRPVYEVYDWVMDIARPVRDVAGADSFFASRGGSWDLDVYRSLYGYWPEVGIVAMDIAADDAVYTWYNNGTVTMGYSWALDSSTRDTYAYTLPPGKRVADIVEIAIASNDVVYTWYRDLTVSQGRTYDLDAISAPTPYTLPPGKAAADIVGIAIAKSTDYVYTWFGDSTVTFGRSWDLDALQGAYSYAPAAGKAPTDIVGMGIASNDHVFTWYRYGGAVHP